MHQKPKSEVVQRNGKAHVGMAVFPDGKHTRKGSTSPCVDGWQSSSPLRPHHMYLQSHRILSWAGDELGTNPDVLQRWSRMGMLIAASSRKLQKGTNPADNLLPKENTWRHDEVLVSLVLPGVTMEWT